MKLTTMFVVAILSGATVASAQQGLPDRLSGNELPPSRAEGLGKEAEYKKDPSYWNSRKKALGRQLGLGMITARQYAARYALLDQQSAYFAGTATDRELNEAQRRANMTADARFRDDVAKSLSGNGNGCSFDC